MLAKALRPSFLGSFETKTPRHFAYENQRYHNKKYKALAKERNKSVRRDKL